MSNQKTARACTQQSNRERPRNAAERKVVFKPVLDNPFRIRWPSVPINLQNSIFAYLLTLVDGVSAYHRQQCRASRKRKREEMGAQSKKKRRVSGASQDDETMEGVQVTNASTEAIEDPQFPPKPAIVPHMLVGINAVTKRLEHQARQVRRTAIIPAVDDGALNQQPSLAYVFVCRAEVNPPIITDHLPPLVAACNSVSGKQFVKLVPLPKDSEQKLADSLGIRSASILAIDIQFPGLSEIAARLESIPLLTASWLIPSATPAHLVPTHIKHVRTSAPKDMKLAKEKRLREKLEAKQKRKQKSQRN